MRLPKNKVNKIEKLGKSSKIVHNLYLELRDYLIDSLDLDVNFVIDNLNSVINDDMTADDLVSAIEEELEDR